jgi:hypothetical protein
MRPRSGQCPAPTEVPLSANAGHRPGERYNDAQAQIRVRSADGCTSGDAWRRRRLISVKMREFWVHRGGMAEWSMAVVLKTTVPAGKAGWIARPHVPDVVVMKPSTRGSPAS